MGALDGIRILDFSRAVAGPYASMMLADHGAEVVKVEEPLSGDESRGWAPWAGGESTYFMAVNRNKRSVALDLNSDQGQATIRRLIPGNDVILHNYRPAYAQRVGLGWDSVSSLDSRVSLCSVTGWGPEGPRADQPAYDLFVAGVGGLMSVTGEPDGPPQRPGINLVDHLAATNAVVGILLALRSREATGRGQLIEISMLETLLAVSGHVIGAQAATGRTPRAASHNQHAQIVPYGTFATADGYINVGVLHDRRWPPFCDLIGRPGWVSNPRFSVNAQRAEHRTELLAELTPIFLTRTSGEWLETLMRAGVACGPINTFPEVVQDPQVLHQGSLVRLRHPSAGEITMVRSPIRLSDTPATLRTPPPRLGEHTEEVLS